MKAIHLIKTFLLLVLVATVSVSCKSGGGTATPETPAQRLNATWKISSGTENNVPIPNIAASGLTISFTLTSGTQGGTYTSSKGTSKYTPSLQSTGSGTWAVNGGTLTLDNTRNLTFSISQDGKSLELSWKATTAEDKNTPDVKLIFTR